jgi:hypothetical protein
MQERIKNRKSFTAGNRVNYRYGPKFMEKLAASALVLNAAKRQYI